MLPLVGMGRVRWAVLFVVALTGCSVWAQARSDPGRTGNNPHETQIGLGTLTTNSLVRDRFVGAVRPDEPVVAADGMAYIGDGLGDVGAYDIAKCAPGRCRPLFYAPGAHPALYGDMLLTETSTADGIAGYDRHGIRNCGGTPVVCAPIYRAAAEQFGNPATYLDQWVVAGNQLLVLEDVDDEGESRFLVAYDLDGHRGCQPDEQGLPFCFGLWDTSINYGGNTVDFGRPAAAGGLAFVRENDDDAQALYAVGEHGIAWSAPGDFVGDPVASDGLVWIERRSGQVDAFDATGASCSGSPKVCTPRWTAVSPSEPTGLAVADGHLFAGTADGHLEVFDATGADGCTGVPLVCAPLWSAEDDPGVAMNAPTIANGVVVMVSVNGDVDMLDAAGNVGCRDTPKVCHRILNSRVTPGPAGPAVVAAGHVFVPSAETVAIWSVR
jgi:outer membrane protein assembly factor BamB